ncbi:MAG: phosphoribosyltransferase family protein [Candidatus Paceibacterota bacterium]
MRILSLFSKLLFPPVCLVCKKGVDIDNEFFICPDCESDLPIESSLFDGISKQRLPYLKRLEYPTGSFLLISPLSYHDDRVKQLILRLKFSKLLAFAKPLGHLSAKAIELSEFDFSEFIVTYIPLHPSRERTRGFNQSEVIARIVSKHSTLPLHSTLKRTVNTKVQSSLSERSERIKNVSGAFTALDPVFLKGKKFLIVDDVCTSGATLSQACRTLKHAGATTVVALAAAKA